jgi:hypothetical protein
MDDPSRLGFVWRNSIRPRSANGAMAQHLFSFCQISSWLTGRGTHTGASSALMQGSEPMLPSTAEGQIMCSMQDWRLPLQLLTNTVDPLQQVRCPQMKRTRPLARLRKPNVPTKCGLRWKGCMIRKIPLPPLCWDSAKVSKKNKQET